jgi:hypothetical protein
MTRLVILARPPVELEELAGTYWVLSRDGRFARHVTERQTTLTFTLAPGSVWSDHFDEPEQA